MAATLVCMRPLKLPVRLPFVAVYHNFDRVAWPALCSQAYDFQVFPLADFDPKTLLLITTKNVMASLMKPSRPSSVTSYVYAHFYGLRDELTLGIDSGFKCRRQSSSQGKRDPHSR